MRKFKVNVNGVAYNVEVAEEGVVAVAAPVAAAGDTVMNAPMPGSVSKIIAREGQVVKKGDVILMLEAMKMQNEMASPVAGTVKSINVAVGESVKPGQLMAIIG